MCATATRAQQPCHAIAGVCTPACRMEHVHDRMPKRTLACRLATAVVISQVEALLALGSVMSGRAIMTALNPKGANRLIEYACSVASGNSAIQFRASLLVQLAASVAKCAVQQAAAGPEQVSWLAAKLCADPNCTAHRNALKLVTHVGNCQAGLSANRHKDTCTVVCFHAPFCETPAVCWLA